MESKYILRSTSLLKNSFYLQKQRQTLSIAQRGYQTNFRLLEEIPEKEQEQLPMFIVSKKYGFLPRKAPLRKLPSKYDAVEHLLAAAVINQPDGSKGLLHDGRFGDAVRKELPLIDVSGETDQHLIGSLFRDYCYLSSEYLLEPCDITFRKTKDYGLARERLPQNIALPMVTLANKIGCIPFLEYAYSYALNNYYLKDPNGDMNFENLRAIRFFEGSEDENGFILTHVIMDAFSNKLVTYITEAYQAKDANDRKKFNECLKGLEDTMQIINNNFEQMWFNSRSEKYNDIRTFILGVKSQTFFPNGVIFEGVGDDTPRFYRGETGANDSIIPTMDNFCEITDRMPSNPLTEILRDFRKYRPPHQNDWLTHVYEKSKATGLRNYVYQDAWSSIHFLGILDQIRDFRHRHWSLTKEYILKHTRYPRATGGSPIVTWLPNQLRAVLDQISDVSKHVDPSKLDSVHKDKVRLIRTRAEAQGSILDREVKRLRQDFPDQDK